MEAVENPGTDSQLEIGDTVTFTGSRHYISANSGTGRSCKPGAAKITGKAPGAAHPYHLIKVAGGGSTVYGWVDAADIADLKPEDDDNQSEPDEETQLDEALNVIADAVIAGKFGDGSERKEKIFRAVQEKVNELLGV